VEEYEAEPHHQKKTEKTKKNENSLLPWKGEKKQVRVTNLPCKGQGQALVVHLCTSKNQAERVQQCPVLEIKVGERGRMGRPRWEKIDHTPKPKPAPRICLRKEVGTGSL